MSNAESTVRVLADQELPASDVMAMQDAQQTSLDAVVRDGLGITNAYSGLAVTQQSSTDVQIGTGRYWKDGVRYLLDAAAVVSMISNLPATGFQRYVSIAVYGVQQDTDSDVRRFLVDATPGAETSEPRPTATKTRRVLQYVLIPGAQGATPVLPTVPPGNLEIARVLLNEAGILSVAPVTGNRVQSLADTQALYTAMNADFTVTKGDVASLRSDLASLASQVKLKAAKSRVDLLASTVSSLQHRMNVAGVRIGLNRDTLQDDNLSDAAFAGYAAEVDFGGIRFPKGSSANQSINLLNPYDTTIRQSSAGLVIPDFLEVARIENANAEQDIRPLDGTPATYNFIQQGKPRTFVYYGAFSDHDWVRYDQAGLPTVKLFDPAANAYGSVPSSADLRLQSLRVARGASEIRLLDPYPPLNTSVVPKTGSAIAQVFLNSRAGWLVSIGLAIKSVGVGILNVAICGVLPNGAPDLGNCLTTTAINEASMVNYGYYGKTFIHIDPVYLQTGERYAVVIVTAGAHVLGTSASARSMQGGLFAYLDGSAFGPTMLPDRDLTLAVRFADFKNPRTVIALEALSLVGGIENMELMLSAYEPTGSQLAFEAQVGGVWRPLDSSDLTVLSSAPNLIPMRMVFKGSGYAMPGIYVTGLSRMIGFRRADAFRHISSIITNGGTSTTFNLRLRLRNYRAAVHSLTASLLTGAGYTTVTAPATTTYDKDYYANGDDLMIFTFAPAASASFRWRLDGATTAHGETFEVTERTDYEV